MRASRGNPALAELVAKCVAPTQLTQLASRVHLINGGPGRETLVKRDDELGGFPASGTKIRKYASLIPALRSQGVRNVALVGSPSSNNIVALSAALIQHGMRPIPCFKQSALRPTPAVNARLTALLVPPEHWHIMHDEQNLQAELEAKLQESVFVLPEGASHPLALPGAATLALDIARHVEEGALAPDAALFLDSGTGFSAAAVCAAASLLEWQHPIYVVCMAGTAPFRESLDRALVALPALIGQSPVPAPPSLTVLQPRAGGKSFGGTTSALQGFIAHIARTSGLLVDPIYSGKLFQEAYRVIGEMPIGGPSPLIVHSGAAHTLLGFDSLFPHS